MKNLKTKLQEVKSAHPAERVIVTPEAALELLEHNKLNRPISTPHVQRIARQIKDGKWRYNGDTIKISPEKDVLDGQHRLWACVEAQMPIETVIVYDVEREAFATIDTMSKPRSGADTLSLHGVAVHRPTMAGALTWLIRWQRGVILDYRMPINRVENSDIEVALDAHPEISQAAERGTRMKGLVSPSVITFLYYVFASFNSELADRMMNTLENPSGIPLSDPFFRLRTHLVSARGNRDPILVIALAIKAANSAFQGKQLAGGLTWRRSGRHAEEFPELNIGKPVRLLREGKEVATRLTPVRQSGTTKKV